VCSPQSIQEAESGGSQIGGQPQLHNKFKASWGYIMRPCLGWRERERERGGKGKKKDKLPMRSLRAIPFTDTGFSKLSLSLIRSKVTEGILCLHQRLTGHRTQSYQYSQPTLSDFNCALKEPVKMSRSRTLSRIPRMAVLGQYASNHQSVLLRK
jgi:hypothetical protein